VEGVIRSGYRKFFLGRRCLSPNLRMHRERDVLTEGCLGMCKVSGRRETTKTKK
jgi:hypothetical protein